MPHFFIFAAHFIIMSKGKAISSEFTLGVLGGGQLCKMLCQALSCWDVRIIVLDPKKDCPSADVCHEVIVGDFNNYDDVMKLADRCDLLTIDIEHVNNKALLELHAKGMKIHPSPNALEIIKDKGLQKQFYVDYDVPTSPFTLYQNSDEVLEAIESGKINYPFVQKSRSGGYDGAGVAVIKSSDDLEKLLDTTCLVEDCVDLEKEIAVIASRNEDGEIKLFPAVEMVFNPVANLVEQLNSPASMTPAQEETANNIAALLIEKLDICGVLAVEFFIDKQGDVLVNEVAPRPHNSGHHTIEGNMTSQYEQHARGILNLPLGDTRIVSPAIMINILGESGYTGDVKYVGIEECMALEGVKFHIYGKKQTKPFRKMGHATILGESLEKAQIKADKVKQILKVQA